MWAKKVQFGLIVKNLIVFAFVISPPADKWIEVWIFTWGILHLFSILCDSSFFT